MPSVTGSLRLLTTRAQPQTESAVQQLSCLGDTDAVSLFHLVMYAL